MRILAIDTSTNYLCIGLYDGKNFYEYGIETGRRLSAVLAPTLKRVLGSLRLSSGDIDYFACGLGPGSFTGLRIGLATIKGLSWAHQKPVIGVSTLDILAAAAKDALRPVVPLVDAKRGLVYCAVYKNNKRISPYMLLSEGELFKKIRNDSIILGRGVSLYPKARHLLELAIQRIKQKKTSDSFSLKPIYLYPKECQIK